MAAALSPANVLRAANDALNSGALERFAGLLADDMLFEDRASPVDLPPSVRGRGAVMDLLGSYREVGRLEADITAIDDVDAHHVICQVVYHLEGDGSGAPTSYRSVDLHRIESGRLCHSVIGLASTAEARELVPLG